MAIKNTQVQSVTYVSTNSSFNMVTLHVQVNGEYQLITIDAKDLIGAAETTMKAFEYRLETFLFDDQD